MKLIDKYKGSGVEPIGEGTFPARISQVLDLGRQKNEYEGRETNKPTLWITFELPTETINVDGVDKPRWLSSEFTKSTNDKAKLFKVVKAVDDNELKEFSDLLGKGLLVVIGTTKGGKDKFAGATALPKGMAVAQLANKPVYFDIENPDFDIFNKLPKFLQDKITGSSDWKFEETVGIPSHGGQPDDEPPF